MKHNDKTKKEHYDKLRTAACNYYMSQPRFTREYAKKQMARKPYATKGDIKHDG